MRVTTIVASGLLLIGAGQAQAATLAAGPLPVGSGATGNEIQCSIVNVSGSPVTATITASVGDATPVVLGPGMLLPAAGDSVIASNDGGESALGYCTFDLLRPSKNVRASACVLDADGNCGAALPAE